jgi:hypothetical protein
LARIIIAVAARSLPLTHDRRRHHTHAFASMRSVGLVVIVGTLAHTHARNRGGHHARARAYPPGATTIVTCSARTHAPTAFASTRRRTRHDRQRTATAAARRGWSHHRRAHLRRSRCPRDHHTPRRRRRRCAATRASSCATAHLRRRHARRRRRLDDTPRLRQGQHSHSTPLVRSPRRSRCGRRNARSPVLSGHGRTRNTQPLRLRRTRALPPSHLAWRRGDASTPRSQQPLRGFNGLHNRLNCLVAVSVANARAGNVSLCGKHVRQLLVKHSQPPWPLSTAIAQNVAHVPSSDLHVCNSHREHRYCVATLRAQLPLRRRSHRYQCSLGRPQPRTELYLRQGIPHRRMPHGLTNDLRSDTYGRRLRCTLHGKYRKHHRLGGAQCLVEP